MKYPQRPLPVPCAAPPRAYVPAALAALLLAACSAQQPTGFAPPVAGDDGVVIASTAMVSGASVATIGREPDDCAGPGLGVQVITATASRQEIYDADGEPCKAAETLFDGSSPLGRRAADPTVQIGFTDSLGPRPDPARAISVLQSGGQVIAGHGQAPASNHAPTVGQPLQTSVQPASNLLKPPQTSLETPQKDALAATLAQWQQAESLANREAARAAARDLENIVTDQSDGAQSKAYLALQSRLREAERRIAEEQRRRNELSHISAKKRAQTEAEMAKWEQEQQELRSQVLALQQRASHYAAESQRLAAEKQEQSKAYQGKIQALSSDLKAAERQADATRNELILQAAAKIAEAEQLAHAARLQEQEIKLREAARLKTEAEDMMNRALAIKAGEGVLAPALQNVQPTAAPMPLAQVPVVLHARDRSLDELVKEILDKAAPQAGGWKADWQLSQENTYILNEKWSLTAEAPVAALLQQLAEQVKRSHNITLTFTQFTTSRLLVVTDD